MHLLANGSTMARNGATEYLGLALEFDELIKHQTAQIMPDSYRVLEIYHRNPHILLSFYETCVFYGLKSNVASA